MRLKKITLFSTILFFLHVIGTTPSIDVSAAEHVHSADCYTGTAHEHTGSSSSGTGCYAGGTYHPGSSWTCGSWVSTGNSQSITLTEYCNFCKNYASVTKSGTWESCSNCGVGRGVLIYTSATCNSCGTSWTCASAGGTHQPTKPGYYDLGCGKNEGLYYNPDGTECIPVCEQTVTSLVPSESNQIIVAGSPLNLEAIATFLDGSTDVVTCTLSGFDPVLYNTEQTVTFSFGNYHTTAKDASPMTTTCTVYVLGYFDLSLQSSDVNMGTVSGNSGSVLTDSSCTVSASANTGYTFVGWSDGFSIVSTDANYTFKMPAFNYALTGVFNYKDYNLNVTIDDSKHGSVTALNGSGLKPFLSNVTVSASVNQGYSFVGWYDGSIMVSDETEYSFSMPSNDLTLEARYTVNSYNLSISIDDIKHGFVSITNGSTSNLYESSVTVSATTNQGFTFDGWYNGTTKVSADETYSFPMTNYDLSLEARYTVNSYNLSISIDKSNHGCVEIRSGGALNNYESAVTVYAVALEGFTFDGWYDGSIKVSDEAEYSFSMPFNDVSLTAKFHGNPYRLFFNADGGICPVEEMTVYFDSEFGDLPIPSKAGYEFLGWINSSNVYTSSSSIVTIASDQTLTAVWDAKTFTITFIANNGTCSTPSMDVTYDSCYGALPVAKRNGYEFLGWKLNNSFIQPSDIVSIVEDSDVFAEWSPLPYDVILLDANGAIGTTSQSVLCDSIVQVSASGRPASIFNGWSIISGSVPDVDLSQDNLNFTMGPSDIVLRANWIDATGIRAVLNSNFTNTYSSRFDSVKGYNIDGPAITITSNMIDLYLVLENGNELLQNVSDFSVSNGTLTSINNNVVSISLDSFSDPIGGTFQTNISIPCYSDSLDNLLSSLGLSSYGELSEYLSSLTADHQNALIELDKFTSALESYRQLLNNSRRVPISFCDSDIISNFNLIKDGIDDVINRINTHHSNIISIQDSINNFSNSLGEDFAKTDSKLDTILDQISVISAAIGDLYNDISLLEEELAIQLSLVDAANDLLASFPDIIENNNSIITDLNNQLIEKDALISELQGQTSSLVSSNEDLLNQINDKNSAISSMERENTYLRNQNNSIITNITALQSDILSIQSQISLLNSMISALDSEIAAKNERILLLLNKESSQQSQITALESEIESNTWYYDSLYEDKANLVDYVKTKEDAISLLESDLVNANNELDRLYAEKTMLLSEIVSTRKEAPSSEDKDIVKQIEMDIQSATANNVDNSSNNLLGLLDRLDDANSQLNQKTSSLVANN